MSKTALVNVERIFHFPDNRKAGADFFRVTQFSDGSYHCTCPGFKRDKVCRHTQAANPSRKP